MARMTSTTRERRDATGTPDNLFAGIARTVLRHRLFVYVAWAAIFVLGILAAGPASNRLTASYSLPGQPGYETAQRITQTFGNGSQPPAIAVVTLPAGQRVAADGGPVAAAFARVRTTSTKFRVVDYATTHDPRFITADGRATFALLFGPTPKTLSDYAADDPHAAEVTIRGALPAGDSLTMTGYQQLESGGNSTGPSVLVETLIAGVGALVVLALLFASFLALVPLMIAAVSILTTLLVVLLLTYMTDVSYLVEFLVSLVGLGVAIDYSLLLVTRWREERARGADNTTAVVTAAATAGRAVALSGLTVAIGLLSLVVLPVPFLRITGFGGMLIPLVSVVVSLTLLPALLGGIGQRIDWPRLRHEERASGPWSAWARTIVHHRIPAVLIGTGLLAALVVPFLGLTVGATSPAAQAQTGPAHDAYAQLVAGGVPAGVLTPIEVLASWAAAPALAARLSHVRGAATAVLPTGLSGTRNGLSDIIVLPRDETINGNTLASVEAVQSAVNGLPGVIGVSGFGASEQDFNNAVFGHFPLMFTLIALVTFVLLVRAFRSPLLAAKAVVLNLISLAATFGFLTWFWQDGHGSNALYGIPATGAITFWLPVLVFAFLFGLSMDYEVFILTRIREEYDRTSSTSRAVIEGLGRTGRLVTGAALILFLAFASLSSAPSTDLKVLATGLGAGILLDATVVRALLVPALVSLFGTWNWWMPRWMERVLFMTPLGRDFPVDLEATA